MKKLLLLTAIFAASIFTTVAKGPAKINANDSYDYSRSSLTVIPLVGHGADNEAIAWADTVTFDGKFDLNIIRFKPVNKSSDVSAIQKSLQEQQIAKIILDYWLQFDGKKFDSKILEQRSRYNVTDADYLRDKALKVSTVYTSGRPLMKNSFVMVAGPTDISRSVDSKGKVTYEATADAHVYQVVITDELLEALWASWLDEDATPEMINTYKNLNIEIEPIASVTGKTGSGSTISAAVQDACDELLEPLEKKIDKWNVVTTIYQRRPLGAKIGKKEGLKNSDRYAAYKVREDENGNLTYKRVGYMRATDVADNSYNAYGNSDLSYFYQISGRGISEGMVLKQKKDAKMSLSFSGNVGGNNYGRIDIDYLINTQRTVGIMQYVGLSVGGDFGKVDGEKAYWIPVAINYGIGMHPVRVIEITPTIGIGCDFYIPSSDLKLDDENDKFLERVAYYAHGGLKFGLQVCYPVHIFMQADYAYKFSDGEYYRDCDNHKRYGRLSIGAGIKINF